MSPPDAPQAFCAQGPCCFHAPGWGSLGTFIGRTKLNVVTAKCGQACPCHRIILKIPPNNPGKHLARGWKAVSRATWQLFRLLSLSLPVRKVWGRDVCCCPLTPSTPIRCFLSTGRGRQLQEERGPGQPHHQQEYDAATGKHNSYGPCGTIQNPLVLPGQPRV